MVEFHLAYEEQNDIGWDMFLRGFVSRRWRHLQHCYLLQKRTKDVHDVDKWSRNFIKSIPDFNRKLWKERCEIVHAETNCTYEDRQRHEIWQLREHLLTHKTLIPHNDWHFLKKDNSFFSRGNLDNVLNWEKQMMISMTERKVKFNRDIRIYLVPRDHPPPSKKQRTASDENPPVKKNHTSHTQYIF